MKHIITIQNRTNFKINKKRILNFSNKIIDQLSPTRSLSFSISFVTPKESQELNLKYRAKDKPTNILTFKVGDTKDKDEIADLGDIFLCSDIINKEAIALDEKNRTEFLIIHGILHLFNYSHESDEDATIMESAEEKILKEIF